MDRPAPTIAPPPAGIDPAAVPANPAPVPVSAPEEPEIEELEFGFAPPEPYDPAEYRWVPVRRKPRVDGWTEEKQRRFIEVLADTGLVSLAAKEVGMTRLSAYRLRRAPYAAAFARAWDVARERAGTLIEDIAFERAIEGVEQDNFNQYGDLAGSKTLYDHRLLTFLLSHLKPERYSREARQLRAAGGVGSRPTDTPISSEAAPELLPPADAPSPRELPAPGAPDMTLDDALRAMEPATPEPIEEHTDPEELEAGLICAEIGDNKLPHFHNEQRRTKSPEELGAERIAAQIERGRIADEKQKRGADLNEAEWIDMCVYYDPLQGKVRHRKPRDGS